MSQFVTLKSCLSIEEAELLRAHLVAEGIDAFVRDAHTAANYGEAVIGGCRLEVMSEDAERAQSYLDKELQSSAKENNGQDIFRVRNTRSSTYLFYAAFLVAGIFTAGKLLYPSNDDLIIYVSGLVLVGASILGRFRRDDYCASCRGALSEQSTICPRCHGTIRGEINHPNERLDALEEYRSEAHK